MQSTPKSYRLHIGIFGRRNVGKSSLLNALTRQETSIVSCIPGTTTDPVEKAMALNKITQKQCGQLFDFSEKSLASVCVFKVKVSSFSGKQSDY